MSTQQLTRIAPQSGCSFTIKRGQVLHVVDPLGEQVSDLFAFDEHDHDCRLSSGRSLDYAGRIHLTTSDILYANNSKPMFTIIQDTVGLHDFLLTPCSQEMFEILYKHRGYHPSCFENLLHSLKEHGISGCQISTTFNIFMNVKVDQQGKVIVGVPMSKSGDYIDLRAEMDMVCGLTACSAEGSNNGRFKPIDFSTLINAPRTARTCLHRTASWIPDLPVYLDCLISPIYSRRQTTSIKHGTNGKAGIGDNWCKLLKYLDQL